MESAAQKELLDMVAEVYQVSEVRFIDCVAMAWRATNTEGTAGHGSRSISGEVHNCVVVAK